MEKTNFQINVRFFCFFLIDHFLSFYLQAQLPFFLLDLPGGRPLCSFTPPSTGSSLSRWSQLDRQIDKIDRQIDRDRYAHVQLHPTLHRIQLVTRTGPRQIDRQIDRQDKQIDLQIGPCAVSSHPPNACHAGSRQQTGRCCYY